MNNPNPNFERDAALSHLLQAALAVENAPESLRNRVAELALAPQKIVPIPRRLPNRHWRLALGAFVVASLWMSCALLWPQWTSDQLMKRVEAAFAQVSSVHMETFHMEKGRRSKDYELWFQNGKWRTENYAAHLTSVFAGGSSWDFDARTNTIKLRRAVKGPFAHNPSGFTFTDIVRDLQSSTKGPVKTTILGESTLRGRSVKRALIETTGGNGKQEFVLLIDAETELPVQGELTEHMGNGHDGITQFVFSYNRRFPGSLFRPVFGPGARVVDVDRQERLVQAQLGRSLAQLGRGLARRKIGERTIVIRALQVSSSGAVWAFYTAGKRADDEFSDDENFFAGRDWKASLTDSLGTRYQRMRSDLSSYSPARRTIGGQRLEGDWWSPLSSPGPGAKWRPRTFSLRFELNPRNLHGARNARFAPDYSARAAFQIPVRQKALTLLPPLASSLGIALSGQDVARQESEERGELPPGTQPSSQLAREPDVPGVFSPDSRQLAAPGAGQVRLQSVADGAALRVFRAGASLASVAENVAFSPDGQTLFALFKTQTGAVTGWRACLWNTRTGAQRASWTWTSPHDSNVRDVTFSPDGRAVRILSTLVTKRGGSGSRQWVAAMDALAEERDALTGRVLTQHPLPHDAFLPDALESNSGSAAWRAITEQEQKGSLPGTVRVWNAGSGQLERQFALPADFWVGRIGLGGDVMGISGAWLDKGNINFSSNRLRLYRISTGEFLREVHPGTNGSLLWPAISRDEKWLAAESSDHRISLWNIQTGRLQLSLNGHYSTVNRLEFSPDGKWLLSGDIKDKTLLWHLP